MCEAKFADNNDAYYEPRLVQLSEDNDEYQMVFRQFLESAALNESVLRHMFIYQIKCKHRQECYHIKKQHMLRVLHGDESKLNEKALYHGTKFDNLADILHPGNLRQFTERAAYGKGTYFARDASFSMIDYYAACYADGFQHVLQANVVCGEWTLGTSSMLKPPDKPSADGARSYLPFETTANKKGGNPSIYVTYQDDQALAKYLISFKLV